MRKTIDLLNEVVDLGFDRDEALQNIDAALEEELKERKDLTEEEIPDEIYECMLDGFKQVLECR